MGFPSFSLVPIATLVASLLIGNSKSQEKGSHSSRILSVVVVTGASAGVGRAVAVEFARRHHAAIALVARSETGLQTAALECQAMGASRTLCIALDVADSEAVNTAADRIERELGPIDCWVNNAMTTVFGRVRDLTPQELVRVTNVTYHGSVYGIQAAMRHMAPRNRGLIVQVGSALAYRSIPLQAAYCGAKSAIRGFIDGLRCELVNDKSQVNVCMVQLPAVNTPQFNWARSHMSRRAQPAGTVFQPEDIACAVVALASRNDLEREVWLSSSAMQAIVGQSVLPEVLDQNLAGLVEGQQTTESEDPQRPHNLYEPIPEVARENQDFAYQSHGRFDEKANHKLWVIGSDGAVRASIALAGIIAVGAVGFCLGRLSRLRC